MRPHARRYTAPSVPFCIVAKISWGYLQVLKMPEDRAAYYVRQHGWMVLIRDSDFPVPPVAPPPSVWQSNPRRRMDGEDGA